MSVENIGTLIFYDSNSIVRLEVKKETSQ